MKKILNYLPYIVALVPQFIFENYTLVLVSTILIGFIAQFFIHREKVFLKIFILETIVFSIIFFLLKDRVFYLNEVSNNLGFSEILIIICFPLLNAVNVSILFFFGYKISNLLSSQMIQMKSKDFNPS